MLNRITVRLPGFFWVKVVDGIASLPAPAAAPAPAPTGGPGAEFLDPGRPPRLTEHGVSELGNKVKLQFAPPFPEDPFEDSTAADVWRSRHAQWFAGAHSVHLVQVDA